MKFIFYLLVLVIVAFPLVALAQDGLVPCGKEGKPCEAGDFVVLAKNVLDFLILLAAPVGALAVAVGGGMYLFSGANEGLRSTAKTILTDAIIGLIIVFAAWLIVNTILAALVKPADLPADFSYNLSTHS